MTIIRSFVLVMALAFAVTSAPVHAAGAANAQQAAQMALQKSGGGGKVLGVSTESDGSGRKVFAVKVLSNGRVRVVRIPQG